ncbi:hypothetical protein OO25_21900 [Phaeobacter sp. S60]|nr:hypothetical protein OO25_21900 [Phaeobacter sp. S60]
MALRVWSAAASGALHSAGAFSPDLALFFLQFVQGPFFSADAQVKDCKAAQVHFVGKVKPQRLEAEDLNLFQAFDGLLWRVLCTCDRYTGLGMRTGLHGCSDHR